MDDRVERLLQKAWAFLDSKHGPEAQAAFEEAATLSAQPARVWTEVGVAHFKRGALDDAEACFRRALTHDQGFLTAWNNLGRVILDRDPKEALGCFKKVLAVDGDNARAWLNSARVMVKLLRWEQALGCLDEAARCQPNDPEVGFERGKALRAAGKKAEGLAVLRETLALRNAYYECRLVYARALDEDGDLAGALAQYETACAARASDPEPRLLRGDVLLRLGRANDARACFDEARGLDKDSAGAWEGLGRALIALGEEPRGRLNVGTGRMLAGDLEAALAEIDRAIALEPDLSEAHANRGGVLKRLGRLDDAAAAYRAALAKDPNAVTVLQNLGLLLTVDMGRWDEGLDVLRHLVRLDPSRWFKLPPEVRSRVDQA